MNLTELVMFFNQMDISYHQDDANNDCVDEGAVDASAVTVPSNDSVMQHAAENSHCKLIIST